MDTTVQARPGRRRPTLPDPPGVERGRARGWLYALTTTNMPPGSTDPFARWLVITRAAVLPMTVVAGLIAGLLAVRAPGFDLGWYLLSLLGITAAHAANNVMNDLFDAAVGSDSGAYPRMLYAPHPTLSGLITRRGLVAVTLAVNLLDLAILAVLAVARGWPIVAFAVGGFLLSAAYTAPPLRLKKRGLGELDVLITWGPLMVGGTYFAATGHLPWQLIVASIPYALLCTAVLMGKHIDKIPYDEPLGIRTVPVLLGDHAARWATRGLFGGFYVALVAVVAVGALPWTALLALLSLRVAWKVWGAFGQPPPAEKPKNFPVWPLWFAAVAFVQARWAGALLVVGVALGVLLDIAPV